MRTAIAAEIHERRGRPFPITVRIRYFAASLIIMAATLLAALLTFFVISLFFGAVGFLLGIALSMREMSMDTAIIGTIGGMIWRMAGALLAIAFAFSRIWMLDGDRSEPAMFSRSRLSSWALSLNWHLRFFGDVRKCRFPCHFMGRPRMARHRLTDQQWELIEDIFPPPAATGRPPVNPRDMVDAILWRLRTGSPWRDLPEEFGPWKTVLQPLRQMEFRRDAG